ncbi:MAG: hypothetical protein AB8G99_14600 [Planctomycetaceae bacterium]
MKKFTILAAVAAAVCLMHGAAAQAQQLSYQQAMQKFNALRKSPAAKAPVHTITTQSGSRFSIIGEADVKPPPPPIPGPVTPTVTPKLAVKVWFEQVNGMQPTGMYMNPEKHKFQRKERFRIWFETATPITLAISQYYPSGARIGKPVYPDQAYPSTFGVVTPGAPFALPVLFAMDDTLVDEHMMLAISDATTSAGPTWNQNQLTSMGATQTTTPADQFGTTRTGTATKDPFFNTQATKPQLGATTSRFLALASDKIENTAKKDLKAKNRFTIIGPAVGPSTPTPTPQPPLPPSRTYTDVQSVMLHANGSGVATFRLNKD